jgi:hypothetical protein
MGTAKTVAAILIAFFIIGLMTTPYQLAQAQTSPLTEDQDGDGDPLNEEGGSVLVVLWIKT